MSSKDKKQCKGAVECHAVNHLCRIIVSGDLGRVKKLVKDAQYYCKRCGRAAKSETNLCKPSKI